MRDCSKEFMAVVSVKKRRSVRTLASRIVISISPHHITAVIVQFYCSTCLLIYAWYVELNKKVVLSY